MKLIWSIVFAAVSGFGCAQLKPYVGNYECVRFVQGKRVDNKSQSPSQVMWLELHGEGNWTMRNALTGFDGTWHVSGHRLVLISVNGPAGKLAKPEKWILAPKPDRRRLVPVSPQALVGQVEFRFDPNIKSELDIRIKGGK